MKAPCKDCCDRFYDDEHKTTCHSNCIKYADYKKLCDVVREKKKIENIGYGYTEETKNRLMKMRKIRGKL